MPQPERLLIPGLGLEVEAEVRRIETDKLCGEAEALLNDLTPGPWICDVRGNAGQNWKIASFGHSERTHTEHILTTYRIHASELTGDAEADAKFCAIARTLLPLLIDERKRQ